MQVSNSLNISDLKTVSSPSVARLDRSPVTASFNSSITSVSLAPDVVTFSNPIPEFESSDLIQPVNQTGSAPDLSPNANQITANEAENSDQEANVTPGARDDSRGENVSPEGEVPQSTAGQPVARNGGDDSSSNQSERLTPQEQRIVEDLRSRDAEVRAHERAHQAVGGQFTGSISYAYQTGPDGKRYAIGGEVPIDVSAVAGDPQATIDKMRRVKAAALAPADPSPQDRSVASTAARILVEAQLELAEQRRQERIEAREDAESNSEQRSEAIALYESFIGIGTREANPKDLIDELI